VTGNSSNLANISSGLDSLQIMSSGSIASCLYTANLIASRDFACLRNVLSIACTLFGSGSMALRNTDIVDESRG